MKKSDSSVQFLMTCWMKTWIDEEETDEEEIDVENMDAEEYSFFLAHGHTMEEELIGYTS